MFDLGGVVVKWEPDVIVAKWFTDPEIQATVHREIIDHEDWLELDRGTLSQEDAITRAARRTGLSEIDVAEFLRQVPVELVAVPETIDLMHRLKSNGHILYCLSNMPFASIEHLERTYSFWELFTGKVISCRLNLCKPEPEIYGYLLKTYELDAALTVFIDDIEANLTAAAQLGIQTIRFESPTQCERELRRLGYI
ncbi:MAG TPA: HAD family phosphatase [Methylomirabilota bacterium]|nr:HAD family phosphatase [Methylomirabilota bacterium]